MDTYNNYNKEVIVKDSLIGEGERFVIRMNKFSFATYLISIVLSLGIPFLFLDWFYKWQIWSKVKSIKNLILSNYLISNYLKYKIEKGKWQYINFIYNYHHNNYEFHSAIVLSLYFYIVAVILLLIISFTIAKKIIQYKHDSILNAEAKYKDKIARRRNK